MQAGDILVTEGGARKVFEYTPLGALVQTFDVPRAGWQDNTAGTETIRDVATTASGKLVVFDGTFHAGISVLDPTTGIWNQYQIRGLSTFNNVTTGKVAVSGNYAFATDSSTAGGEEEGIVRINLSDGTWTRFASGVDGDDVLDISMGGDGLVYSMNGNGSPAGQFLEGYDPVTLAHVKHIELPQSFVWGAGLNSRSFAVDALGNMYLNQLYGPLFKMSPTMDIVGDYSYTQTSYIDDMDRGADGTTLLTEFDGRVVLLDASGAQIRTFETTGNYYSESFGTIVAVPEPGTLVAFSGLALGLVCRRKRSS